MIFDYDETAKPGANDPDNLSGIDLDNEFVKAKTFLQKSSNLTGDNLYDHLTEVLNKILAERPENVIDFFEEYSRKVKEKRFKPMTDHLEDIYVSPLRYELAKKIIPFLRPPPPEEASTVDPEDVETADMSTNDMLQLLYYFEQCGIGLPRDEMFAIMLSMRKLVKSEPISALRFWGKIYGTYKNYIVLETELREEEVMKRLEIIDNQKKAEEKMIAEEKEALEAEEALEDIGREQEMGGEDQSPVKKVPRKLPPAPKIQFEEVPECPDELPGIGVNKKTYYVCNEAGDPWVALPDVTAKQIRVARQICKAFTGSLVQPVITYPDFPGLEKNLLRAQIARISAGTQISPLGFYTFGGGGGGEEEEEEEEEEEAPGGQQKTTYKPNKRYEPPPINDLTDGSMSFWVHHTLYVLPQGRTSWWNPYPKTGGGEEEELGEEEEEEKPKGPKAEPETGPPLLTPLSEDASLEAVPPWSVRTSSALLKDYAIAIVRSNLWPGAYCFSTQGKIFQNVYLGNGLKYIAYNFSPLPLPPVQQEYPLGPEIMEIKDPTGAEEEAWRVAHLPKPKPPKKAGEEEEAEEEEEEEEDD